MAEVESLTSGPGRRLPWVGTILSLAGIGVATYLTISHFTTSVTLACPETGIVNCAKVTSSSYSYLLGIPVALLGLGYFVAMLVLQLPPMWRLTSSWVLWLRLALAAGGIPMILWLIYAELFKLNAICLYCTAVHVLTVALFGLTAAGTAMQLDKAKSDRSSDR